MQSKDSTNADQYTKDLKKRVLDVIERINFQSLPKKEEQRGNDHQLHQLKRILNGIKVKSEGLRNHSWTDEELKQVQYVLDFYMARIEYLVDSSTTNLEWYESEGWKLLVDRGDRENE